MGAAADRSGKSDLTPEDRLQVHKAVRGKYLQVSSSAAGKFKYTTGKEGAAALAYNSDILDTIPDKIMEAFCGVGNPFLLGEIPRGGNVLDIGCGAGFDLIVARKKAGPGGRVCGVDLTREMIERSRTNFRDLGIEDIETFHIDNEKLPFADGTFDVVISNGAINLSPAKKELFGEIYRVLRPGGRVQIADMVLEKELPPHLASSLESWSQ